MILQGVSISNYEWKPLLLINKTRKVEHIEQEVVVYTLYTIYMYILYTIFA